MSEVEHFHRSESDSWICAAERLGFTVDAIRFMIEREQENAKKQRDQNLLTIAISRLLRSTSKFKSGGLCAVDVLRTLFVLKIDVPEGLQLEVPDGDKKGRSA